MSHPDPNDRPDLTPIRIGEVWDNPVTGERAMILERPHGDPAVQRASFAALASIAHWRGYRATYPQLSRTVLAPRE